MKSIDSAGKFEFVGSEKDFEFHLIDNLNDISQSCGWGEVKRWEQQFTMRQDNTRVIADLMLWHTDGTGTVIECKKSKTNRNDILAAIGQVLFYGTFLKARLSNRPRLVIAAPSIPFSIYSVIQEFKLPINLLIVDGDKCTYLS